MTSEISTFISLNCPLCKTPYSKTADSDHAPTQSLCLDIQSVCMKCYKKQKAIERTERAHQCKDINCFHFDPNPSYYLLEFLSNGCFFLDKVKNGYVLVSESITIPECPICHEEYSIENSQREPFALYCGHALCNGCFNRLGKLNTAQFQRSFKAFCFEPSSFKHKLECPLCQKCYYYDKTSWEDPLKKFLHELPLKQAESKRLCADCRKKHSFFTMFKCIDCNNKMLCSLCVCKKHHQHQIVDLETEEVKCLMSETIGALTPQINAYDVYFPELQSALIRNMTDFKQGVTSKIDQLGKLAYAPAKQERQNCLAIGDQFEKICKKYLRELRLCNTGIEKLINGFSGSHQ